MPVSFSRFRASLGLPYRNGRKVNGVYISWLGTNAIFFDPEEHAAYVQWRASLRLSQYASISKIHATSQRS